MNRCMWTLVEGTHGTYRSIPTDIPQSWERWKDEEGYLFYSSGEYQIERDLYHPLGTQYVFRLTRQSVPIGDRIYARLGEAKRHAERNARGEEVVNVA